MRELKITKERPALPPLSWAGVRPIYRKLSEEFSVLLEAYNINLDKTKLLRMDYLIVTMDAIDQCIDNIEEVENRNRIMSSMLTFIGGPGTLWDYPEAEPNLKRKLESFKQVILHLGICREITSHARSVFKYTEEKRHTDSFKQVVDLIQLEGESTAELPLEFLMLGPNEPFIAFFKKLCRLMGVADFIFDARSDFRSNRSLIQPSISLYMHLLGILIKEGWQIFILFPKKRKLIAYVARFVRVLMKGG